jgi:hypothetical protein
MSKKTRDRAPETPRRFRAARFDGTVGALEAEIEKVFVLPQGCIKIIGRGGKDKRSDATVKSLRSEWESKL